MSQEHDLAHYQTVAAKPFTPHERDAVYRAIHERRDMRHFAPGQVDEDVLLRLLRAAHHAPSVGFMQPWRFIRIRSSVMRQRMHQLIEQERMITAELMGVRQEDFMQLKVQGVLDAAEVLVVALPPGREVHVFGRRTMPEMDMASAACAIQNMWLAARAEGLGMGWVSIYDPKALAQLLYMPEGSYPLAVLCLGPVQAYYAEPMLQQEKWALRAPLHEMLFDEQWGQAACLGAAGKTQLTIAIVDYPYSQNLQELQMLQELPQVNLVWAQKPAQLEGADCVVLPDSTDLIADLAWMRAQKLDAAIVDYAHAGLPVWGIGAGLPILGEAIIDADCVDGNEAGLGLLPVVTQLPLKQFESEPQKVLLPPLRGVWQTLGRQVLEVTESVNAVTRLRSDMEEGQSQRANDLVPGWLWQSAQGNVCASYWIGVCANPQWLQVLHTAHVPHAEP